LAPKRLDFLNKKSILKKEVFESFGTAAGSKLFWAPPIIHYKVLHLC